MNEFENEFFQTEDEKYGGLDVENMSEALDYFSIEEVKNYKSFDEDDLNHRIETDYHNAYYLGDDEYGLRQNYTENYHDATSVALEKRRNEPEGAVKRVHGELVLTEIGKAYYAKEIKTVNKKFAGA